MKTDPAPPSMAVMRLSEADRKLHGKLLVSHDDIALAQYCASVLLKKGWHDQPWERRGKVYEQQAVFTTALVTSYGRPFTNSRGWPRLPENMITYDHQEQMLHDQIMKMRHTVYAHSDSVSYRLLLGRIGTTPITLIRRPVMRITADDTKLFLAMTDKLLSSIISRIEFLAEEAEIIPLSPQAAPTSRTKANITLHRRRQ